jgi:membrane protein YqaA with SNARE-associated domain
VPLTGVWLLKGMWGWLKPVGRWLVKAKVWLILALKPFGAWGILGLSMIDSAAIPLPFLDPLVVSYGVNNHAKALLYCVMAALGSAIGCMLPYYIGRAGGELFLLKRINRERFEKLRDRFEKQEFLAIMLPAMMPPPMPVKLFELAAGVFEMKPLAYFLAICSGKMVRFSVESIITIVYGPTIFHAAGREIHDHAMLVFGVLGVVVLAIGIWVTRMVFDKKTTVGEFEN